MGTIYDQVERERARRGLSRTGLARAVGELRGHGMNRSTVQFLARKGEGASGGGNIRLLVDIAEALGCELVLRRRKP